MQQVINSHTWHPCSQMHDYNDFPPLIISHAAGSYITLSNGKKIIDAISSWWCKSLGHGHPRLRQALLQQANRFEHVLLANTQNNVIESLSAKLAKLSNLDKVFYASDGSCAVEIAMKMSLHARQICGESQRNKFMTLQNSYHGETGMALSASDCDAFRTPYKAMLIDVPVLQDIPYVNTTSDPLWNDCSRCWPAIEKQLQPYKDSLTAILVEPIIQGAGGMRLYSQDFLKRLRLWTQKHNIHLIADEIMTGIGRTGLPLACQHANIIPDFICLGKGLTSGWLPLSAVMTSNKIYDYFYHEYGKGRDFLHSHTYSGNPLAASVALACLQVMEEENIYQRVQKQSSLLLNLMHEVAEKTGQLTQVRGIGAIVVADLINEKNLPRAGYQVYKKAVELGALLRPLGNTLYWSPPLNVSVATLKELQLITMESIEATF